MKRTIPAVLIAAALALAGCSSTSTDQASTAPGAALPTATAEAKVNATAPPAALSDAEQAYLAGVEGIAILNGMSDSEKISFGLAGCEQLREGTQIGELHIFPDETPQPGDRYPASQMVTSAASETLCPDLRSLYGD